MSEQNEDAPMTGGEGDQTTTEATKPSEPSAPMETEVAAAAGGTDTAPDQSKSDNVNL